MRKNYANVFNLHALKKVGRGAAFVKIFQNEFPALANG